MKSSSKENDARRHRLQEVRLALKNPSQLCEILNESASREEAVFRLSVAFNISEESVNMLLDLRIESLIRTHSEALALEFSKLET